MRGDSRHAISLSLRTDYSPADLRRRAKKTKDNNQSRRLLSLAAVLDGMNRTDAARIGGMDRQTLRDWVHRFNDQGPDGLCDIHAGGVEPRLNPEKLAELRRELRDWQLRMGAVMPQPNPAWRSP